MTWHWLNWSLDVFTSLFIISNESRLVGQVLASRIDSDGCTAAHCAVKGPSFRNNIPCLLKALSSNKGKCLLNNVECFHIKHHGCSTMKGAAVETEASYLSRGEALLRWQWDKPTPHTALSTSHPGLSVWGLRGIKSVWSFESSVLAQGQPVRFWGFCSIVVCPLGTRIVNLWLCSLQRLLG